MKVDPEKVRSWRERSALRYSAKAPKPRQGNARASKGRPRNDAPWRNACIARYGEWCRECGSRRNVQMDHMLPRGQGGPSDVRNGLPLCRTHHEAKTAGTLKIRPEWLDADQVEFLAGAGWVHWLPDGSPAGRGMKHFAARSVA